LISGRIVSIGLIGVTVDQRPTKQRMAHAAYLVLDREQHRTRRRVYHVLEPVFVRVRVARHKAQCGELAVWMREVGERDLQVVTVERALLPRTAKDQPSSRPGRDPREVAPRVLVHAADRAEDLDVEIADRGQPRMGPGFE